MERPDAAGRRVHGLIGVYDADGTLRGELSYWVGARLGRRHCSLCDITHGSVRERSEWRACRTSMPVPFETYHRNDQPDDARTAAGGQAPVVVATTDDGMLLLLGPDDLDSYGGSIDRLVDGIDTAMQRLGLTWAET